MEISFFLEEPYMRGDWGGQPRYNMEPSYGRTRGLERRIHMRGLPFTATIFHIVQASFDIFNDQLRGM